MVSNKRIFKKEDTLKYYYKNDKNIPIGVLGMVDDTITISECGAQSVSKNAVLNSFIENQRLTLSDEKSCVIHIGNPSYCVEKCPSLRVHDKNMKVASSAKYLGDIITSKGGSQDTIIKRRNEGWGRVSEIMGLISEIPSGCLRIQIGLKMRETKLCNGLIFNGEAWSSISDKDIERLEQVDLSLIRSLTGAHSKTVKEFLYLELRILKLRHILTIRRLLYHYHIITRDDKETIKKVYLKQKEACVKGDWITLLAKDFNFIQVEQNDEHIMRLGKKEYSSYIKRKVENSAFKLYLNHIRNNKKKTKDIFYEQFELQPYFTHAKFGKKEIKLMCLLRSKTHPAKANFKKLNRNNLKCSLLCNTVETQEHIFQECQPIRRHMKNPISVKLNKIFGTIEDQVSIIDSLIEIECIRKSMLEKLT